MQDSGTIGVPQIPEIPAMTLAQQKVLACRVHERLQEIAPVHVARQTMQEEEVEALLGGLLRIAKTLDDADNFIDIREKIDPKAHERALRKLNEELMPRARPRKSFVEGEKKAAGPAFVPKPFDSEEVSK